LEPFKLLQHDLFASENPFSNYMQEFLSYNDDSNISSQPIFSYNKHFGEQPLHFHVKPPETVSPHNLEYYEVCYMADPFLCVLFLFYGT
jgi:hypothetical protein